MIANVCILHKIDYITSEKKRRTFPFQEQNEHY